MRFLTRDELNNPTDLETLDLPLPELGNDVGIRLLELGAAPRARVVEMLSDDDCKMFDVYAVLLEESMIGEDGKKLCGSSDEALAFCGHSPLVVTKVVIAAMKLSKLNITEEEVEDAVKNSGGGTTDA
jgi:hypothetical protein